VTWPYASFYQTQWVESIQFKRIFLDGQSSDTYCG
jgi:hypothetical protein